MENCLFKCAHDSERYPFENEHGCGRQGLCRMITLVRYLLDGSWPIRTLSPDDRVFGAMNRPSYRVFADNTNGKNDAPSLFYAAFDLKRLSDVGGGYLETRAGMEASSCLIHRLTVIVNELETCFLISVFRSPVILSF